MEGYTLLRGGVAGLLLTGNLLAAGSAGEPAQAEPRMPSWVVVRPGAVASQVPRPIEPTSFDVSVGQVPAGTWIPIDLEFRNTSTTALKILGGNSGCSLQGCCGTRGVYPIVIPPGEKGRMLIRYKTPSDQEGTTGGSVKFEANFYVGATTTFAVPYRVSVGLVKSSAIK